MKLAGLMPYALSDKPDFGSMEHLASLVDTPIILLEGRPFDYRKFTLPDFPHDADIVEVASRGEWNDYGNRLVLLARAASLHCDWVLWLDSDERLEPRATPELLREQIAMAEAGNFELIEFHTREMWNPTHYRNDGIWGRKRIIILQKNPLMKKEVRWRDGHLQLLHQQALHLGDVMHTNLQMLHFGMSTPELRTARRDKYNKLDPTHQFQPVDKYDYLTDETGMELVKVL